MTMDHLHGRPVIIGGGIAGLMTALHLAPEPVVLISKTSLGDEASSTLAQGGIAVSLGSDDSADLHLADTLAAGDGLCDEMAVRRVVEAAPQAIEHLARLGVAFDQAPDGTWLLGLEAAHSRRRIVHAGGDVTGRAHLPPPCDGRLRSRSSKASRSYDCSSRMTKLPACSPSEMAT